MRKVRLKKQKKTINRGFLFLTLLLTGLGMIAIADASAPQALNTFSDQFYFVKQQLIWGIIGLGLLIAASKIHYSLWEKLAIALFVVGVLILGAVLFPELSSGTLGAKRWVFLGPISFQPAEFVKLALAVYLARAASRDKGILTFLLPMILVAALIMLQPDFGTTFIISMIGISQIFASGISLLPFIGVTVIGAIVAILAIIFSDYRKQRLLTFLKYTTDPLGSAYHIRQVLLALGSGGLLGVGLGQSRQKYLFLPEAATDSIFAVIAEELGFVGATFLIILFAVFIFSGLRIAARAPDKFSQVLAVGIIAWIGGQAFLNIGSMTALVPLTGIPLPFFSYGGSALTTTMFAVGILLNISRYETKSKKKR